MFDLERACYTLILLQEIPQGYDTNFYRLRAYISLMALGVDIQFAMNWKNHAASDSDMLKYLESLILDAAKKADTDQSSVPR